MSSDQNTDELLRQFSTGGREVANLLLARHREKLRRMIASRLDPRVAGRFDPSDVVQDTLVEANRRLAEYARERPLPFYPWLRKIAWDRLCDLYRRHLRTNARTVLREAAPFASYESLDHLTSQLADSGTSPTRGLLRRELQERVRKGLLDLAAADREILLMRHLEQMSISEIAAALEIRCHAAKSRLRRALERLHRQLERCSSENAV